MSLFDLTDNLIQLSTVDSTNDYLKELVNLEICKEGTIVIADEQKRGKGTHGTSWSSETKKNITFSFSLFPTYLGAHRGFLLNVVLCVGISKMLDEEYDVKSLIKWPNDILVNNKKICGILVENTLRDQNLQGSVLGIGLNVNQRIFPPYSIGATSMALEKNSEFDLNEVLKKLTLQIDKSYNELKLNQTKQLLSYYLERLYGFEEFQKFQDMEGFFEGKIIGLTHDGNLIVETRNGQKNYFSPKSIRFTSLISEDAQQAY